MRSAVETRMGIEPLEQLQAKRRELVGEIAELRARYGSFGTTDAERKIRLATIRMKVRAQIVADGVKMTEAAIDDMAHSDPGYVQFITETTRGRASLQIQEDEITCIDEAIRRDQSLASFLTAEARLT